MIGVIKETKIKTVRTELHLSDYCKGCNYFSPEKILLHADETEESYLATCENANMCDEFFRRVIGSAKDQ